MYIQHEKEKTVKTALHFSFGEGDLVKRRLEQDKMSAVVTKEERLIEHMFLREYL